MTTRNDRQETGTGGGMEKHVQTALLSLLTLLMSWGFYSMIQLGKDVAVIQAQLTQWIVNQNKLQEQQNKLGLDNNQLQLEVGDLKRRVDNLEHKR